MTNPSANLPVMFCLTILFFCDNVSSSVEGQKRQGEPHVRGQVFDEHVPSSVHALLCCQKFKKSICGNFSPDVKYNQ